MHLQRSKSICCGSEACLFSQEQRNESDDGVMGLEPAVQPQIQPGLGGEGATHALSRVLIQIQTVVSCTQVRLGQG